MPEAHTFDRRQFLAASGVAIAMASTPALAALSGRGVAHATQRRSPDLPWITLEGGAGYVTDPERVPGGNVLAIPGEGGVVVVDAKFTWLGAMLAGDAGSLPSTDDRGVVLVNTHHHADHTAGNWAFRGSAVYAHANAAPRILAQHERYLREAGGVVRQAVGSGLGDRAIEAAGEAAERVPELDASTWSPTVLVADARTSLTHAGRELELLHFGPGHTDNDVVVLDPSANIVHTGDLVFHGYFPFCDQSAGVTIRGWIGSLWKILERCDGSTTVVPGHGPVGSREMLRTQIDFFEQLLDAAASEIDAGVTRDDAIAKVFPFMQGLRFEQIRPIAIGAAYDEVLASK